MVAITVILAAVIGTFVLGLGDQVQTTAPNSNFEFNFETGGDTSVPDNLTVTHSGGDGVDVGEIYLRGDVVDPNGGDQSWENTGGLSGTVRAGDQVTVSNATGAYNWSSDVPSTDDVETGTTVRVVWESSDSDQSSTLRVWERQ